MTIGLATVITSAIPTPVSIVKPWFVAPFVTPPRLIPAPPIVIRSVPSPPSTVIPENFGISFRSTVIVSSTIVTPLIGLLVEIVPVVAAVIVTVLAT